MKGQLKHYWGQVQVGVIKVGNVREDKLGNVNQGQDGDNVRAVKECQSF